MFSGTPSRKQTPCFCMSLFETRLTFAVTVHDVFDRSVKGLMGTFQQLAHKSGFAALAGSGHDDAAGRFEKGVLVRVHHEMSFCLLLVFFFEPLQFSSFGKNYVIRKRAGEDLNPKPSTLTASSL